MDKKKEKETLYRSLADLSKNSDPLYYFSRNQILDDVKKKIEKKFRGEIDYRALYKPINGDWSNQERIDINEILPKKKNLAPSLEELAIEEKINVVKAQGVRYYRAKI